MTLSPAEFIPVVLPGFLLALPFGNVSSELRVLLVIPALGPFLR